MSAAQISDLELDRLLGEVPPPPLPAADLADRIAARALRTPQERASRFAFVPRHRPRKRATLWTAVIAANLVAAAAAAASWDGQRFDFNRLADLPNRVAVAVHIGHHHRERALVAQRKVAPVAHIAPSVRTASAIQPEPSRAEAPAARAGPVVMPPMRVGAHLANRLVERPRPVERETAAAQSANRIHPFQHRVEVAPHRVARLGPRERLQEPVSAVTENSQLKAPDALPRQERVEQRPATAGRQQVAPDEPVSALPPARLGEQRGAGADRQGWRSEEFRRRVERWRNQWHQRERPREGGRRFRRRF